MQQIWKDIVGYEGLYKVSNLGNVISLHFNHSKMYNIKKLKPTIVSNKYKNKIYNQPQVRLYKNGNIKHLYVSRLVYSAFKGEIPNGFQIDHKDANSQNNRLDNLQLLTRSENQKKKFKDNPNLITGKPKRKILCLNNHIVYESLSDASRKLNLRIQNLWAVLNRKSKHVKGYIFRYLDEQTN